MSINLLNLIAALLLTFAVLHNDDERVVAQEALLVINDVWMRQVLEKTSFHHAALLLFRTQTLQNDFLCHIFGPLCPMLDKPCGTYKQKQVRLNQLLHRAFCLSFTSSTYQNFLYRCTGALRKLYRTMMPFQFVRRLTDRFSM